MTQTIRKRTATQLDYQHNLIPMVKPICMQRRWQWGQRFQKPAFAKCSTQRRDGKVARYNVGRGQEKMKEWGREDHWEDRESNLKNYSKISWCFSVICFHVVEIGPASRMLWVHLFLNLSCRQDLEQLESAALTMLYVSWERKK